MDKSTLSNYGWIVIVTLVLAVMLALASPFGSYVAKGFENTYTSFTQTLSTGLGQKFTYSEIEKDPHLYGIGKTKPEFVIAEYNDDYTEVTIYKNGIDSDGLMKDWEYKTTSVFQEHKETLKKVVFENGIKCIGNYAFMGCKNIEKIKLPSTIEEVGMSTFSNCYKLQETELPESLKILGKSAFSLTNLKSIEIPDNLISLGAYSFQNCSKLESVKLSPNLTVIDDGTFQSCSALKEIIIPDNVINIGISAFSNCSQLSNVVLSKNTKKLCASSFASCRSLSSIELPQSLEFIGSGAFADCIKLKELTIPQNVNRMEMSVFSGCTNLKKITMQHNINGTPKELCLGSLVYDQLEELYLGDGPYNALWSSISTNCPYYTNKDNWDGSGLYSNNVLVAVDRTIDGDFVVREGTVCLMTGAILSNAPELTSITIPESVKYIYPSFYPHSNPVIIYGKTGSAAETWANARNYTFIAI